MGRGILPEQSYKKVLLLATIQVSCFHVFAQSLRQIFNWITKVSPQTIQVFWFNVFAQVRRQMMGRLRFEAIKHLPAKINLSAIKFFPFDVSMWTFDQIPRIWEWVSENILPAFLGGRWEGGEGMGGRGREGRVMSNTGVRWLLEDRVGLVCNFSICILWGLRSHSMKYTSGTGSSNMGLVGQERCWNISSCVFARLEFREDSVSCSWNSLATTCLHPQG